jgi:hypothetical protein
MPDPTSVKELDLSPIPGKKYFTIDREWREESFTSSLSTGFRMTSSVPQAAGPAALPASTLPTLSSEGT